MPRVGIDASLGTMDRSVSRVMVVPNTGSVMGERRPGRGMSGTAWSVESETHVPAWAGPDSPTMPTNKIIFNLLKHEYENSVILTSERNDTNHERGCL